MIRRMRWFSLLLIFILPCFAGDEPLQKAISAANEGRTAEAISQLESLRSANPNDVRVLQSLGLLYKSAGRYQDALETLEAASRLNGSAEATYALSLLYEYRFVHAPSAASKEEYRQKALNSWNRFLAQGSANAEQMATAQRHVKTLSETKQ